MKEPEGASKCPYLLSPQQTAVPSPLIPHECPPAAGMVVKAPDGAPHEIAQPLIPQPLSAFFSEAGLNRTGFAGELTTTTTNSPPDTNSGSTPDNRFARNRSIIGASNSSTETTTRAATRPAYRSDGGSIGGYNPRRLHSTIGHQSPNEWEDNYYHHTAV